MKQLLSVMMTALILSGVAMAEGEAPKDATATPGIDKGVMRQKKRIARKVKHGKITQEQANELNKNVDEVQVKKEELAKDGNLNKEDRKVLRQKLKKNGMEINKTGESAPATSPAGH